MENRWTWSIYIHLPTKVRCSSIFCRKLWKKSPEATTFSSRPNDAPGTMAHTQLRHGVCVTCSRRCPVISRPRASAEERPRVERTEDLRDDGRGNHQESGILWDFDGLVLLFFMGFGGDYRILFFLFLVILYGMLYDLERQPYSKLKI